ncbi:hypothetical protein V8C86DRAFT_2528768, partial [Haematococcus lacustris]
KWEQVDQPMTEKLCRMHKDIGGDLLETAWNYGAVFGERHCNPLKNIFCSKLTGSLNSKCAALRTRTLIQSKTMDEIGTMMNQAAMDPDTGVPQPGDRLWHMGHMLRNVHGQPEFRDDFLSEASFPFTHSSPELAVKDDRGKTVLREDQIAWASFKLRNWMYKRHHAALQNTGLPGRSEVGMEIWKAGVMQNDQWELELRKVRKIVAAKGGGDRFCNVTIVKCECIKMTMGGDAMSMCIRLELLG